MLESVQKVMLVEVPYQVRCHNVFKNLAEYTGEGDWCLDKANAGSLLKVPANMSTVLAVVGEGQSSSQHFARKYMHHVKPPQPGR